MSWVVKKLNFTVDLNELNNYYEDLKNNFEYLRWDFAKCQHEITDEWRERIQSHYGADRGWGWAIQSNLVDENLPCPPYNISTHPQCQYRNTKMAKGIILRLQTIMPYTYRWSLFVQCPGGTVPRHVDQYDECTGHIPLQWDTDAVFECGEDENNIEKITMPADGSVYLVNTLIPHATFNRSNRERIGLVFRFHRSQLENILKITGQV